MPEQFEMTITEIFRFRDGRSVLVGEVQGHVGYISRGRFEVRQDGELCGLLDIEGEMIASRSAEARKSRLRSVSTTTAFSLTREFLDKGPIVLNPIDPRGGRESQMHRHSLGIESPPSEYLADPMTQGPVLPEGWDGDAWESPKRRGSFLLAWNKQMGRVAYGRGPSYEDARRALLEDLSEGGRPVEVTVRESSPA